MRTQSWLKSYCLCFEVLMGCLMKWSRMGNWLNVNCSRVRSLNYWGLKSSFGSGEMMNQSCLKNLWKSCWRKHWNNKNMIGTPYNRSCYMRNCKIWSSVLSLSLRSSILDCFLNGCYRRSCSKMKALRSCCLMIQKTEANCRKLSYCCLRWNVN